MAKKKKPAKRKPVTKPAQKPRARPTLPPPAHDRAPDPADAPAAAPAERSAPAEPSPESAQVVDITPENEKLEGYRVVQVIALRVGHYGLKQRVPNEVFMMGLLGEGALPDWVKAVPDDGTL